MTPHIAAQVAGAAAPGEALVSRTIVDLLLCWGLHFADRGEHTLKGLPGLWWLSAIDSE